MAETGTGFLEQLKSCIVWSWTYLWTVWFFVMLFLVYILRVPLKINDNLTTAMFGTESSLSMFLNTLTPKFYVALTGTSSLISGLILIFEWWYFRKYGTSFIEQVSVSHLRPLLGGVDSNSPSNSNTSNGDTDSNRQSVSECKVWRNPLNLFRGAEYNRYTWVTGREPLTYYDMNLSAQDHQTFFTCDTDHLRPADAIMQKAWRERNPQARISAAHEALELNECATAYILLAEEEATTIVEAEKLFKQALKAGEGCYRRSQQLQHHGSQYEAQHRRDTNVLVYIKRRLAMCARKLGRTREAVKMMRDNGLCTLKIGLKWAYQMAFFFQLMKEFPLLSMFNIHENLLEALLELQAYADVQAVLAKYDDISLPKSATICYTAALLKARAVSDKFSPEAASRRGLSTAEMNAVEAIHRAVEFNPHVPKYLLEMKSLILPPEHILKRGDSEAIAYAFFHLQHWKRVEGALNLLHCTWEGTFRMIPYPLEKGHLFYPYPICTETADRELLPSFHEVSVYPKKELPFFILFTAGLCSFTAMLALLTHQFPELMGVFAKAFLSTLFAPLNFVMEKVESILPSSLWHQLTRI
ncbi:suppressor of tumorigenicity 7 protein homolog isoform X1 [Latimeria chalumnae]|uniref:suppressor of tumorigenicity 7 protein homolog isoform X1 n=1 Tax=Latimeria chalumnae TaxID=7897 RepID=UPI0006D902F6|nr:PREDICTED: suppressor of tumorigenicity 7 protein isoform X1 [Latimeria chalumnae]|eukprot:XP_014344237.1 PREDICTED: suppressor of tumorigenicity 7 protein isoform X1 [Latimeria chalumnae]